MQRMMVSAVFLALAGCGTPQQQCINSVTRNLQIVDELIYKTQANLARGFAYENATISTPQLVDCTDRPTADNPDPPRQSCWDEVTQTISRPVAIDLDAEAAKLASLQRKRTQLATASGPSVLACQQQYPEAAR